jgi:hypothetical protein
MFRWLLMALNIVRTGSGVRYRDIDPISGDLGSLH